MDAGKDAERAVSDTGAGTGVALGVCDDEEPPAAGVKECGMGGRRFPERAEKRW
jgi:hypothetical protein